MSGKNIAGNKHANKKRNKGRGVALPIFFAIVRLMVSDGITAIMHTEKLRRQVHLILG